jgi:hypothetical protein
MIRGIQHNKAVRDYVILSVLRITGFILLGSFLVHWINAPWSRAVYYLLVCLYILIAKDNIFCIALAFILVLNPWGLFYSEPYSWFINITPTVGIKYSPILAMVVVARKYSSNMKPRVRKDFLVKYYLIFFFYFLFLIFWGSIFGYSPKSFYDVMISIPVILIFLVLPKTFSRKDLLIFNKILFSFFIVHTIIAFIDIYFAGSVSNLLIFGFRGWSISMNAGLIRLTGGIGLALYCMIVALYYLINKSERISPVFLWSVVIFAWLYIFNSATRGWMIATIFLIISYFLYYYRWILINKRIIAGFVIVLLLGLVLIPGRIRHNLSGAIDRLSTVEAVVEGDMTAEGTARRWDIRGPYVLSHFRESPVFGFGFSSMTAEYYDGHVGNHSVLLMGGIAGLLIVWTTIAGIAFYFFRLEKIRRIKGVFIFGLALVAIMIIHSSSRVMVSYILPSDTAFIIAILFNHVNAEFEERYSMGNCGNIMT